MHMIQTFLIICSFVELLKKQQLLLQSYIITAKQQDYSVLVCVFVFNELPITAYRPLNCGKLIIVTGISGMFCSFIICHVLRSSSPPPPLLLLHHRHFVIPFPLSGRRPICWMLRRDSCGGASMLCLLRAEHLIQMYNRPAVIQKGFQFFLECLTSGYQCTKQNDRPRHTVYRSQQVQQSAQRSSEVLDQDFKSRNQ